MRAVGDVSVAITPARSPGQATGLWKNTSGRCWGLTCPPRSDRPGEGLHVWSYSGQVRTQSLQAYCHVGTPCSNSLTRGFLGHPQRR